MAPLGYGALVQSADLLCSRVQTTEPEYGRHHIYAADHVFVTHQRDALAHLRMKLLKVPIRNDPFLLHSLRRRPPTLPLRINHVHRITDQAYEMKRKFQEGD